MTPLARSGSRKLGLNGHWQLGPLTLYLHATATLALSHQPATTDQWLQSLSLRFVHRLSHHDRRHLTRPLHSVLTYT